MHARKYSPAIEKLKGIISLPADFDYKKFIEEELVKKYQDLYRSSESLT